MGKKVFFITACLVVNIAVIFAIGEIYARTKHGETLSFKSREARYRRADFELHHSLIPNSRGRSVTKEWDVPYSINSLGLRDKEYPVRKDKGAYRILVIGDSFAEGYGVKAEDSFAKVLERKLNGSLPGGREYEVINCGVASYSPLLEYLFLKKRGLALKPDMVILFYDFADLKDDYEYEMTTFYASGGTPLASVPYKRVRAYGSGPLERFLVRHSMFYLYLENRINKVLFKFSDIAGEMPDMEEIDRFIAFRQGEDNEKKVLELWERSRGYLQMIYGILEENDIKLVIASYPYAIEVSEKEWSEGRTLNGFERDVVYGEPAVAGYLQEFAGERGISFIDLYPDFRESGKYPLYYAFDGHFNANGHSLVAESLFRELTDGSVIELK